jgi:hypothetical protein
MMVPVWKLVSFHSLNKVFCSAAVDCNPWVEASGSFVESLNESNEPCVGSLKSLLLDPDIW